jgi:hypothetical protein
MSLRVLRLSAAFVLTGLAFAAAPTVPALADGLIARPVWHHPRHVVRERVRTVQQIVYVPQYTTSCGCGSAYATPQYYTGGTYIGYRHIAPQPYYYGGYAPHHRYHQHAYHGGYQSNYYSTADVRPAQYSAEEYGDEQEPAYVAPRRHRYGYPTLRVRY